MKLEKKKVPSLVQLSYNLFYFLILSLHQITCLYFMLGPDRLESTFFLLNAHDFVESSSHFYFYLQIELLSIMLNSIINFCSISPERKNR